jgi:hypothetical protein
MSTAEGANRRRKLVGLVALFMMFTACSSAQGSSPATTVDIQPELADPNDGIVTRSEVADFIAEDFLHKPLTSAAVSNLDHSILQDGATLMCEAATADIPKARIRYKPECFASRHLLPRCSGGLFLTSPKQPVSINGTALSIAGEGAWEFARSRCPGTFNVRAPPWLERG